MAANEIGKIFNVKRETSFSPLSRIPIDDFPVPKVIETIEGTIQKTPVNGSDIVNKAYVDSVAGGLPQGPIPLGSLGSVLPQGHLPLGSMSGSVIPQGAIPYGSIYLGTGSGAVDNSTADLPYVPLVLYNTDATPPAASSVPVGTIYIQYTA